MWQKTTNAPEKGNLLRGVFALCITYLFKQVVVQPLSTHYTVTTKNTDNIYINTLKPAQTLKILKTYLIHKFYNSPIITLAMTK